MYDECYDLRVGLNSENSIKKNSILLARNSPVALVVGAAGFLGSSLVDELLSKNIQVVGLDNLSSGKKTNLQTAIENKNFHFIIDAAQTVELELPRLDYLIILASGNWNLNKILGFVKKSGCRCLLVSTIDLYDKEKDSPALRWYKEAESKIAQVARDFNLNARVLRLGTVFGPRMHFRENDPIVRLIQQSLKGKLQEVSLEFSSRALFISDAVDLMVKTIFAGSTAQKIFDGVSLHPVKVSEIKQVLLDPVWYENRDFIPTELPPWPTPNLDKTVKFLNWKPKVTLISALRQTLSYFKDHEVEVPDLHHQETKVIDQSWEEDKKKELAGLKGETVKENIPKPKVKRGVVLPKFSVPRVNLYLYLLIALVTYALIWPMLVLAWGGFTFHSQLNAGLNNLQKGDFNQSLTNIDQANSAVVEATAIFNSLEPMSNIGIFKTQFTSGQDLLSLANLSTTAAKSTVLGVEALFQSLKAVTGEIDQPPAAYFDAAQIELGEADVNLSQAYALLNSEEFDKNLPGFLKDRVESISQKLKIYSDLVKKARAISNLLPNLVAIGNKKDYLILMQNNMELRPTGGFIGSFAKVSFEGGKLKNLVVNDVYAIDGQLKLHVEPPKEILTDLGQKEWFLRDSNFEPDFPTSARQAEWFYTKETGERVEGVVALDISAMAQMLTPIGSLDLTDYGEKITADNLFEKAVSHAEISFFPGSQAKKSFLTALTNQLFNKIFFLPGQNWPGIVSAVGRSLEQKHISIYLNDPKLFSYLLSQNWAGVLPRQPTQGLDKVVDFLAPVEANLGANKSNYYLDRSYNLETVIGKDGEVSQRLKITYTNKSPSVAFPAGPYKNRMRIYLPAGAKMTRALFGEVDITKSISGFVDYGRTGYSMLLEVAPKEVKTLVLDYQIPQKLIFNQGMAKYRLDLVKQAGTGKDPFVWKISYPINYQLISSQNPASQLGPQEQTITTDLSTDRSFELEFKK